MTTPGGWLIDGRTATGPSGVRGIGTYARGLLEGLAAIGHADHIALMLRRGDAMPAELARLGLHAGPGIPVLKRRLQPVADALLVSVAVRRARPLVYHGLEYAQPLAPGGVPVVVTVHDLIPFVVGGHYRWLRRERLLALHQLRHADAVITGSRAAALDIERIARVDPARITVIPYGVDPGFSPAPPEEVARVRAMHGLDRPYLLVVGTQDPRKRVDLAVAVADAVRRDADVDLVVAGSQGNFHAPVEAALGRLGDRGRLLGFVETADLVALLSGATALLFTSSHEGFGLPVLEALATGTAAIAFDNTALPEAAGDAGILVRDGDVEAMTAAALEVLGESAATRADRSAAGRTQAAALTWERSARAHVAVYEGLGG